MSRTIRKPIDGPGVRPWYQREAAWARKSTNRSARNKARQALRTMTDPDEVVIDDNRSTGGWITH